MFRSFSVWYTVLCLVAQLCLTLWFPWTVACQDPLSLGVSRQEYWNGLPCPPPGALPNPGIKLRAPALQVDSLAAESPAKPKNTGVGISRGSSRPRNWTRVSCIAGGFFTSWATWEAPNLIRSHLFIFVFISISLGDWAKEILIRFVSENVLPMFFSRSFMVSLCLSL